MTFAIFGSLEANHYIQTTLKERVYMRAQIPRGVHERGSLKAMSEAIYLKNPS